MSGRHECRKCGQVIYWHRSKRTGNSYPCNSDNPRDFHKCDESKPQLPQPQPTKAQPPLKPDYFGPTLEERVANLEGLVSRLMTAVKEISGSQPITDRDIPF